MSKRVTVIVEGRRYIVEVGNLDETPIKATVNNKTYEVDLPERFDASADQAAVAPDSVSTEKNADRTAPVTDSKAISAPMPGDILEIRVKVGDTVNPGDVVCVLEAMKMKNMIHAREAGVVASVLVYPGQSVDYGAVLVTFE